MEGGLSADRRAHSKITRPHPTIPTRNIPGRLSLDAPTHHPQSQLPPTGSYLCPSAAHAPRRRPPGLVGSASPSTPARSRSSPHATLARPHAPARGALRSRPMRLGRAAPVPPPVPLGRARSSPPIAWTGWFGEPVHPSAEPLLAPCDARPPPRASTWRAPLEADAARASRTRAATRAARARALLAADRLDCLVRRARPP